MQTISSNIQGSVMVVGAGVTGIQTALDLADSGFLVTLVERSPAIGGMMSWLDKTFPTNDCAMCILSPKLVEVGRHLNIEILSNTQVARVDGEAGDFAVTLKSKPRYIDSQACTGCGECAAHCPVSALDMYNKGMRERRAVYIDYPQAVPLSFTIDQDTCIGCGLCENMCLAGAIKYSDQPVEDVRRVGAVVLSVGTQAYDPQGLDFLGYGQFPNVVTSAEFERILSASGPYFGHLMRPRDRREPQKIAWLQCVGSRDLNRSQHAHCSSVCCMYAIKEALIAKEHSDRELDCAIFYMDMRTYGKDFERCYMQARDREGVRFIHSRIHTIEQVEESGDLSVQYFDENKGLQSETFDMVVLSVGLEVDPSTMALAERLGIELNSGNFCQTSSLGPVSTSRPGIYVSGAFQGPKDIPTSVIDASAAAASAGEILHPARHSQTQVKDQVPQRDVLGDVPRIGVFVCKCGSNIAGVVDVPAVRDYAATLPYVEYATDNLYTCSQNTQEDITRIIKEKNLNRVLVASCTPKTHEPLFQETLINAGLNKYLFQMANIRNLCSWVHKDDPHAATDKAKDLVRMTAANLALSTPLQEQELDIDQRALVIGGGLAGMAAAVSLARQGHETHVVERTSVLGGQARRLYTTWRGEDIPALVQELIDQVEREPNIRLHLKSEIVGVQGYVGNFSTTVRTNNGQEENIAHGVTVVATGAREYRPKEYLYGEDPRVKTSLELDEILRNHPHELDSVQSTVFIQCVGSRETSRPYCSRVCCTHSISSAVELKKKHPSMDVYVLYRDIRTYGQREEIYNQARQAGVIFIRYDLDTKPQVSVDQDRMTLSVMDPVLQSRLHIKTDVCVLAAAIVPNEHEHLAQLYKLPVNEDGFFAERHVKLGPSEFAIDGIFLCGMAHYPKSIDESIAQGKAAASRAVTLLAREKIFSSGEIAEVNPVWCSGCGVCVAICPYAAPRLLEQGPYNGKANINASLCKGCGLCAASCRSGAIELHGGEMQQFYSMIEVI